MYGLGCSLSAFLVLCLGLCDAQTWKHVTLRDGQPLMLEFKPVNVSFKISWYVTIAGVEHMAGVCQLEMTPGDNGTVGSSYYTCTYTLIYMDGLLNIKNDSSNVTSYLDLNHVTSNVTRARCIPHTHQEDNRYWNITVVVEPSRPQCTWMTSGTFLILTCSATLNPGGVCTLHEYYTDSAQVMWNYTVTYTHITYKTQGLMRTTCYFHGKIVFPSSQHLRFTVSVAPNVTYYSYLKSTSSLIDFYVNEPTPSYNHVTHTTWRYSQGVTLKANSQTVSLEICTGKEIIFTCQSDGTRGARLELYKTSQYHTLAFGFNPWVITYKISSATDNDGAVYGCVDRNVSSNRTILVTVTSCDYSDTLWARWNIMAIVFGVAGGVFILGLLIACCFRKRNNSQRSAGAVSVQFRRNRSVAEVNLPSIDTVDGLMYHRSRQMWDNPPPYSSVVDSSNEISTRPNALAANTHTEEEEPPPPYPGK